nr:MAG TPA: hypothetical protein [Caudoviricetes sp.]
MHTSCRCWRRQEPPYKPENRGLAQITQTSPRRKAFERKGT